MPNLIYCSRRVLDNEWLGYHYYFEVNRKKTAATCNLYSSKATTFIDVQNHEPMTEEKQARFMEAYNECHDAFIRYCSAIGYGKMDTQDLVQDVLLSAYKHFDKLKSQKVLLHYLIRAAKKRSISVWRKSRRETALQDVHNQRLIAKGASPEQLMEIRLLYEAINKLPTLQKEALLLFEISGFSFKEIAQFQGSTEGAVKTKVSRGRKRLRRLLRTHDEITSFEQSFVALKSIML